VYKRQVQVMLNKYGCQNVYCLLSSSLLFELWIPLLLIQINLRRRIPLVTLLLFGALPWSVCGSPINAAGTWGFRLPLCWPIYLVSCCSVLWILFYWMVNGSVGCAIWVVRLWCWLVAQHHLVFLCIIPQNWMVLWPIGQGCDLTHFVPILVWK